MALAWALWPLACVGAAPDPSGSWTYTVAPGDTLIGIATAWLQHPGQWRVLQRSNGIGDPRRLPVGRVLELPVRLLRAEAAVATLVASQGDVRSARPGGTEREVQAGQSLLAEDTLRTGPDASALVEFADGSRVELASDTRLTLRELLTTRATGAAVTRLDLHQGRTETEVPPAAPRPRFEVRTPVMTLGVRGTHFRVEVAGAEARAEVTQGQVWVDAGTAGPPSAPLAAGFGVVARAGRIEPPRPLLRAPDLSAVPARIERLPLQLRWPGDARAVGWRAQVLSAGSRHQVLRDGRFTEARATWGGDLPDGDYVLRVRPIDEQGLEGSDAERAFVLKARPEPPPTLEPRADTRLYGPTARWRWAEPQGDLRVHLQVAADAGFTAPEIDAAGLDGGALERPLAPGRWHWRVASVRPDGDTGPWSEPLAFEQRAIPPAPQAALGSRDDGVAVVQWSRRAPGDRYQAQLAAAEDAAFATPLTDRTLGDPMLALDPAPRPGHYALRIRTIDADGYTGPWSAPTRIDVPVPVWWWLAPLALLLFAL